MKNTMRCLGNLNRARSAKVPLLIIGLVAVIGFSMTACDDDSGNNNNTAVTYTVTFNANGATSGIAPAAQSVVSGSSITLPSGSGLTKTGYTFGGWNANAEGTGTSYAANASYTVTANITLYAKWEATAATNDGTTMAKAIPLIENVFADGNLPMSSDEQWFTFEATASTQYLHIEHGTLTDLNVNVYESGSTVVGTETRFVKSGLRNTSQSLETGNTYYIRVRPNDSYSGIYQIAFTATPYPPGANVIPLTENVWADDNILTNGDQHWFVFIATASTQYFHAALTQTAMSLAVYNSGGTQVGTTAGFNPTATYISRSPLAVGQTYYIRVASTTGIYKIAFNTSTTKPTQ